MIHNSGRFTTRCLFCLALVLTGTVDWRSSCSQDDDDKIEAAELLQIDEIIPISIELSNRELQAMRRENIQMGPGFSMPTEKPYEYHRGDVRIGEVSIEGVGIRRKGFLGSQDAMFPSLLVDFDRFEDHNPIRGLGRLTLNNNKQDTGLVSQLLAYHLFRKAGIAAPQVGFAEVSLNGDSLGVYANVESIKKSFLKNHFGEGSGPLYEGTLIDLLPESLEKLEQKQGDDEAQAQLAALAEMLASKEPLDLERLEKIIALDEFMTLWAMEGLIGFWDGYSNNQNNYFIYHSPEDGLLHFIPWGADGAFNTMPGFGGGGFGGGFGGRPQGPQLPTVVYAQAALANRLYFTPGIAQRYRERLQKLLDEVWNEQELLAQIDQVERLVEGRLHERQGNAVETMERVRAFVRGRREEVATAFEQWPAAAPESYRLPTGTSRVGEVSGTFSTLLSESSAAAADTENSVEIRLVLKDEEFTFTDVAVAAHRMEFGGFGPGAGPAAGGPGRGGPGAGGPPRGPGFGPGQQGPGRPGQPGPGRPGPGRPGPGRPGPGQGGPNQGGPGGPFGFGPPPLVLVISGTRESNSSPVQLTLMLDSNGIDAEQTEFSVNGFLNTGEAPAGGFGPPRGPMVSGTVVFEEDPTSEVGDAWSGTFELELNEMRGGFMNSAPMRKPEL